MAEKDLRIITEEGQVKFFESKYHLADEKSKKNQKHIEELIDIVERNTIVSKLVIIKAGFRFMVLNATFNNISAISIMVVSFIDGENQSTQRENHRTIANHWQTLSHNIVSQFTSPERGSNSQR